MIRSGFQEAPMTDRPYRTLFLSRRNSARSVMAAAVLNKLGAGKFEAFSAAVDPAEAVDPHVLQLLADYPKVEARPRHFQEFAAAGAADLDFVFTLSDTAAGEALPEWPGLPVTAHWSSTDPILEAEGVAADWERSQIFARSLAGLERRLRAFVNLPFASLDRLSLASHVEAIGRDQTAPN
jgi:protein-tyrosine-phosphatase